MKRRTFDDVVDAVKLMTSSKPERCPDNIAVTRRVVAALGLDATLNRLRYVHIAGTKGKGTTATLTSALLRARGLRVGLFTSPHLIDVRERVQINNKLIAKQTFADYFFEMHDRQATLAHSDSHLVRESSRANFFRFMFCLSLYAFEQEKVDCAVLEVGIGGRLDATNIGQPAVCGITALGMDHMDLLGSTVELIAGEKAGILKAGVLCFSDPQRAHPSTRAVLERAGASASAPVLFVDPQLLPIRAWPRFAIGGEHTLANAKLALCLSRTLAGVPVPLGLQKLEIDALSTTTYAGRSQILRRPSAGFTYFLDGAHTPESIAVAAAWFFPSRPVSPTRPSGMIAAGGSLLRDPDAAPGAAATAAASSANVGPVPAKNVLVFYTTRDQRALFKGFYPYVPLLSLVVFVSVDNPKVGNDGSVPDGHDIIVRSTELWREVVREVPCVAIPEVLTDITELETVIVTELQRAKQAPAVAGAGRQPQPQAGEAAGAGPVNVLVTGSLYLIGDFLKLLGHTAAEQEQRSPSPEVR